jgi:hypothetical protein
MANWQPWADARRVPAVRDLATLENLNESELKARAFAEANGSAGWARWTPNVDADSKAHDANLQVDIEVASLALT